MRSTILGALGVAAIALGAAQPARATVKIGLLTDFSGTQGAFGALYKDGVDIFLKSMAASSAARTCRSSSRMAPAIRRPPSPRRRS